MFCQVVKQSNRIYLFTFPAFRFLPRLPPPPQHKIYLHWELTFLVDAEILLYELLFIGIRFTQLVHR
jgi:hypothetical protein